MTLDSQFAVYPLSKDETDALVNFTIAMARLNLKVTRIDVETWKPVPRTEDVTFMGPTGRTSYRRTT